MKLLIVFAATAFLLPGAEAKTKKVPHQKAAATAAPRANLAIPARAVKNDDGSYRFSDAQGKNWIYWRTPFGVSRKEDKPAGTVPPAEEIATRYAAVRAIDAGDTVRFERPGPFGTYKWERKKTELDEIEQMVWDRETARTPRQD